MIVELWTWGADSQWKMKAYETVQTMETTLVIGVYSLENRIEVGSKLQTTAFSFLPHLFIVVFLCSLHENYASVLSEIKLSISFL